MLYPWFELCPVTQSIHGNWKKKKLRGGVFWGPKSVFANAICGYWELWTIRIGFTWNFEIPWVSWSFPGSKIHEIWLQPLTGDWYTLGYHQQTPYWPISKILVMWTIWQLRGPLNFYVGLWTELAIMPINGHNISDRGQKMSLHEWWSRVKTVPHHDGQKNVQSSMWRKSCSEDLEISHHFLWSLSSHG